jgi:hypothetical protein
MSARSASTTRIKGFRHRRGAAVRRSGHRRAFPQPQIRAAEGPVDIAQIAALQEFQSKATSQILALQNRLDSFSGQDLESLKARNEELEAELDAIHQAERDKVDGEIEALRQRNVAT